MIFEQPDGPVPSDGPGERSQFTTVASYYDELMANVPYRQWIEYIERVWDRHGIAPRRILDLACGTGTVTRLLQSSGYETTGVDISGAMLDVARRRSSAAALPIPFYEQDAASLDLGENRFDAVICLFDSLNYILDPARLQSAFARVRAHLGTPGSFLFDVNTEYALEQGMFNQSNTRRDEPLRYRWRSSYDADSHLCTVRMRFEYEPGDGPVQIFYEVHTQRAYGKDDIRAWLLDAGFAKVTIYDAYTLRAARRRSDRLFFLAET